MVSLSASLKVKIPLDLIQEQYLDIIDLKVWVCLRDGPMSVDQVAKEMGYSKGITSKSLGFLSTLGWVTKSKNQKSDEEAYTYMYSYCPIKKII